MREEVRERFEAAPPGGGFIFCTAHNIQADTRWRISRLCSMPISMPSDATDLAAEFSVR